METFDLLNVFFFFILKQKKKSSEILFTFFKDEMWDVFWSLWFLLWCNQVRKTGEGGEALLFLIRLEGKSQIRKAADCVDPPAVSLGAKQIFALKVRVKTGRSLGNWFSENLSWCSVSHRGELFLSFLLSDTDKLVGLLPLILWLMTNRTSDDWESGWVASWVKCILDKC